MRSLLRLLPALVPLGLGACAYTYTTAPGLTNTVIQPSWWPASLAIRVRGQPGEVRRTYFDTRPFEDLLAEMVDAAQEIGEVVGPWVVLAAHFAPWPCSGAASHEMQEAIRLWPLESWMDHVTHR